MVDLNNWPVVPKLDRPKTLYVNERIEEETFDALLAAGWDPIDIRLMDAKTEADRAKVLLGFLEGVRLGSIDGVPAQLKFVELEAKICGLLRGQTSLKDEPKLKAEDLDSVLSFGKNRIEGDGCVENKTTKLRKAKK